jgi:hypothetical protein
MAAAGARVFTPAAGRRPAAARRRATVHGPAAHASPAGYALYTTRIGLYTGTAAAVPHATATDTRMYTASYWRTSAQYSIVY